MNGISRRSLWRMPALALAVLAFAFVSVGTARADALHVTDDADVRMSGGKANDNYGKAKTLVVSSKDEEQVFLRFDVSVVPSATTVDRAVLRLWVGKVKTPGDIDVLLVPAPGAGEVLWDEDTITGVNAPDLTSATFVTTFSVAASNVNDFVTVDMTGEVQDWLDDPTTNYGIVLVPHVDVDIVTPVKVTFDSKENAKTSHQPEIEIIGQGVQGAQGPKGDTGAQGPKGDKGDKGDTGAQGPKGDKGDTGAQGPKGDKGDTGDTGLAGYQRTSRDVSCPAGNVCTWNVFCSGGRKVLGAGFDNTSGGVFGGDLRESYPGGSTSEWIIVAENFEPFVSRNFRSWVTCAFTN